MKVLWWLALAMIVRAALNRLENGERGHSDSVWAGSSEREFNWSLASSTVSFRIPEKLTRLVPEGPCGLSVSMFMSHCWVLGVERMRLASSCI